MLIVNCKFIHLRFCVVWHINFRLTFSNWLHASSKFLFCDNCFYIWTLILKPAVNRALAKLWRQIVNSTFYRYQSLAIVARPRLYIYFTLSIKFRSFNLQQHQAEKQQMPQLRQCSYVICNRVTVRRSFSIFGTFSLSLNEHLTRQII